MCYIHLENLNQLVTIKWPWFSFIPVERFISALILDNNFVVGGFAIRLSDETSEMPFAVFCSDCPLSVNCVQSFSNKYKFWREGGLWLDTDVFLDVEISYLVCAPFCWGRLWYSYVPSLTVGTCSQWRRFVPWRPVTLISAKPSSTTLHFSLCSSVNLFTTAVERPRAGSQPVTCTGK